MTGEEVRKEKERIHFQIEDLEHEMRKEFELELQQASRPYYDKIRMIRDSCPHEYYVAWTNGHNGNEEYECKFCGKSE